ncbi:MAG: hypothetical protein JNK45_37190 [Myxococcales bacterium]|nr:hypothetical protein [Myxococcales bacterium]
MDTAAAVPPQTAAQVASARPSPLRALADEIFERTSPYEGVGLRNHCRRLHRFATALLQRRGLEIDVDLAYLVAMVHDLGIVSEKDEGVNYLQRSRALFHRETAGIALPPTRADVLDECLVYNHRVLSVPNLSPEAECFRNAVMIEHSRGMLRFGLSKDEVRPVFDELPRGNFDRVLMDFTWRTIKREPLSIVRGIFF